MNPGAGEPQVIASQFYTDHSFSPEDPYSWVGVSWSFEIPCYACRCLTAS